VSRTVTARPGRVDDNAGVNARPQRTVDLQVPDGPFGRAAPLRVWGIDGIQTNAIEQMHRAAQLPIAVRAALMPDAHLGYGIPIGGVLATDQAVIPNAVGVDIACRVKLSIVDLPAHLIETDPERLAKTIEKETRFGVNASFQPGERHHDVLDEDWSVAPVAHAQRDRAWRQLGTSGSGNHFVEFGTVAVTGEGLPIEPGKYLGLLSHSGSRGTGATVCEHYRKVAMEKHPELTGEFRHLAWLSLDSHEGQQYWNEMELMGRYASANHACIHRHVLGRLGAEVLFAVENHHNFAWKERLGEREVVVHRKGATPAASGVLGFIPGSMAAPGYLVRGTGDASSIDSSAHGAGRVMSRSHALKSLDWRKANELLRREKVKLLSAGLDEVPFVYKDIDRVMEAQRDLVETLASFHPRIVKMAPSGERPED